MRRRTEGVLIGDDVLSDVAGVPHALDDVIAALEPIATDARKARIHAVLSARMQAVTVIADAIHDPHNGAALVRTCDAFGVQTLHVVERTEAIAISPAVSRGSQKWVDVVRHQGAASCIDALRESGHEIVATHPEGELVPDDLAGIPRLALLLGNEREGIAPDLRAAAARAVRVPMVGFVESLNVSVTAAILVHAATHGRAGDLSESHRKALYARALWLSVPHPRDTMELFRRKNAGT